MNKVKNKLYLRDDFAQHFNFIYASTNELRREAYQIRLNSKGHIESPLSEFEKSKMVIDQYDTHSRHLLLQNKDTKEFAACVRIIEPSPQQDNGRLPFEKGQENIWVSGSPIDTLPRQSFSEMSRLTLSETYLQKNGVYTDKTKITLGLTLAAYSLARLLFHDSMFAELSIEIFKKLRANGLLFEQASGGLLRMENNEQKSIFCINLGTGISPANPVYELQQHILNEVAHQLNIPLVHDADEQHTPPNEIHSA